MEHIKQDAECFLVAYKKADEGVFFFLSPIADTAIIVSAHAAQQPAHIIVLVAMRWSLPFNGMDQVKPNHLI